ncbi:MAG: hypothetical protein IJZ64_09430 [Ruminococcus sp.]|nr:hypothetical protein [Ruminococcus sp.]
MIGITEDDPRISFETFAKGFTYLERKNFIAQSSGYDDEVIIDNYDDLEMLEQKLDTDFDESEIDFDEYMLYINFEGNFGDKRKIVSYDIDEIGYNDNVLVVIIDYDNSETIETEEGEWLCFYNISKIKKSDFPYESRDFLRIPKK